MPPETMTEKDLEAMFSRLAKPYLELDIKIMKTNRRGFPDRLVAGWFRGRIMLLEFKSPKGTGRLSQHQSAMLGVLNRLGIRAEVVQSRADVERLVSFLKLTHSRGPHAE